MSARNCGIAGFAPKVQHQGLLVQRWSSACRLGCNSAITCMVRGVSDEKIAKLRVPAVVPLTGAPGNTDFRIENVANSAD